MRIKYLLIGLIVTAFAFQGLIAQSNPENTCSDCPLPKHPNINFVPKDSSFDIYFKDMRSPLYDVRSIKRSTMKIFGKLEQALQIKIMKNGICFDTLLQLREIDRLSVVGLGLGGQTLNVPLYPAREYYREEGYSASRPNFIEITGNLGYFGSDKSDRSIGIDGITYGGQLLIAPFGKMLGSSIQFALGSGVMIESSRLRIPVMGHLRWTFMGSEREEEYFNYFPSACKFGMEGERSISINERSFVEVPATGKIDSTVYYYQDKKLIRSEYRPYLFIEGGALFDGGFDGAGSKPSLNPDDYSQYFLGLGVGMPFFDLLATNLSFRYMRTNLRTPCLACDDKFILNTDKSFGLFLSVGLLLEY